MLAPMRYCAVAVFFVCALLTEQGASTARNCEYHQFMYCFEAALSKLSLDPFKTNTSESLNADCANVNEIPSCTKHLVINDCEEDEKRHLRRMEDGLRSTTTSVCDKNLFQSMAELKRCINKTVLDSCFSAYTEERDELEKAGRLSRDEMECKYGAHSCFLKATEGCDSSSVAMEAIKNVYNSFTDLHDCPRFDGSSGEQRCDDVRFERCFRNVLSNLTFTHVNHNTTVESLAGDCATAKSVDDCTKYMVIEGCSDEPKQRLRHLKRDFDLFRSDLCDAKIYESMLEWNKCFNSEVLDLCFKEIPFGNCSRFNCLQNATEECPPKSLAMKAMHHMANTYRDLEDCTRVEWNSGTTQHPKIWLLLFALCISRFALTK